MGKDRSAAGDERNPAAPDKKGRGKSLVVVGALMIAEGIVIFAAMNFVASPPETTMAAEDAEATKDPLNLESETELDLCTVDAFNRKEGKLFVYHVQLSVLVAAEDAAIVERFIKARTASIQDRVQEVIRAADPAQLNDPALELIKRQLLIEMNNLLGGKELISKVLIAKMLQSRTNL